MSSPIVNLKKTNIAPEKVIRNGNNGSLTKSKNIKIHARSIEEEVGDIRRNSNIAADNEKMIIQMSERMANLENLVKDVKDELTKAVEVINRKDVEIEMLKEQLLKDGRKQTHPHISTSDYIGLENEYLSEQYDKLNDAIYKMQPGTKGRTFYRKGDFIHTGEGKCDENRCSAGENIKNQGSSSKKHSLYEELEASEQSNIKKRVYEDKTDRFEDDKMGLKIKLLERVDDYIENSSSQNSTSSYDTGKDLETEYERLAQQIDEMETFLADYGMIWVGEKKIADEKHGDRIIQTSIGFTPNFDKVIMVVGELNHRASSENHIKITGNEAKFQKADMLNLTLYCDGMQLEDNPFREYSTDSVKVFFQDLEDGYYPTELKDTHPEGVIFKINDRRDISYADAKQTEEAPFSGPGYRLGTKESSDEEPDSKDRLNKSRHTIEEREIKDVISQRVAGQEVSITIGEKNEALDDTSVLKKQEQSHEIVLQKQKQMEKNIPLLEDSHQGKEIIPITDSHHDGLRNNTFGMKDNGKQVIEKQESVTNEKQNEIQYGQEFNKHMEHKITQTDIHQEFQDNIIKSSETQTLKGNRLNDDCKSCNEKPSPQYRDNIKITNITYHEAPSTSLQTTRHITIGETQSEPALISSSVTSPHHRGYQQNVNQRRKRDDEMSYSGFDDSDHKNTYMTSEYDDAYTRNAPSVAKSAEKKSRESIPKRKIDITKKYEHITFLGADVNEKNEDEQENKGIKNLQTKKRVSEDSFKSETDEVNVILLNEKTSDEQIELNMSSYNGKDIYSAYLYPDDTIGKIWSLTKLNSDDFEVVTADDKVLDLNVPLKNYNIDGDVTLNILKRKQHNMKKPDPLPSKLPVSKVNEDEAVDSPDEDEDPPQIEKDMHDEEGYSS